MSKPSKVIRFVIRRLWAMARKVWKPVIESKPHVIEVKWNIWSNSGELLVDGRITDAWSASLTGGGTRHFEVAGKPAMLVSTAFSYNLIIDGQKIKQ